MLFLHKYVCEYSLKENFNCWIIFIKSYRIRDGPGHELWKNIWDGTRKLSLRPDRVPTYKFWPMKISGLSFKLIELQCCQLYMTSTRHFKSYIFLRSEGFSRNFLQLPSYQTSSCKNIMSKMTWTFLYLYHTI